MTAFVQQGLIARFVGRYAEYQASWHRALSTADIALINDAISTFVLDAAIVDVEEQRAEIVSLIDDLERACRHNRTGLLLIARLTERFRDFAVCGVLAAEAAVLS